MFKYVMIALLVLLLLAQAVRPLKTNPPVDPARTVQVRTQIGPQVLTIFDRACKDCHSHATTWPWYSHVAPVSWLVARDVREGRRELNLSDWAKYNPKRAGNKLKKICEEVKGGDMPLWFYRPLHPGSKLSVEDKQAVCAWTEAERQRLK